LHSSVRNGSKLRLSASSPFVSRKSVAIFIKIILKSAVLVPQYQQKPINGFHGNKLRLFW
jgi:hypothetical protein